MGKGLTGTESERGKEKESERGKEKDKDGMKNLQRLQLHINQ